MIGNGFIWLIFAVALALSFLLSGMEAGVFAMSRIRIQRKMRAGSASAKLLHDYLEHPENFLWTIVVGNTAANFFIFGWMIFLLQKALGFHVLWFVLGFSAAVFLFYTFFDLLPKMLFRAFPTRLCLLLARPFRFIHFALAPLVWFVEGLSGALLLWTGRKAFRGHLFGNREELRFIMQESGGALSSEERAMINRVLDVQSATLRQITKPMGQIVTADADWPASVAMERWREHHFTRLPVWEKRKGGRRIAGLISLNTLLFQQGVDLSKPLRDFMRPAIYLDEDLRIETALGRMQRSGQRMAIVLARDGRDLGVVTLQDILKAIFGEVSL
jgi:CBS domain containing-hemolysin-like protein